MRRIPYILLSWLAFVFCGPVLAVWKKTRAGFWQRLGWYRKGVLPASGSPRVWFHGASAGDVMALAPMVSEMRRLFPSAALIVSTLTDTGYAMATARLHEVADARIFAPWDLWETTRRAVRAIAPDLLVLEYAEIWPNLIATVHASGGRVAMTNGRLSSKNIRGYRGLIALGGNPFLRFSALLMRSEADAAVALKLGAPSAIVEVTGSTKFDAQVTQPSAAAVNFDELAHALGILPGAPTLVAGSTHDGEEAMLLDVFRRLHTAWPDLTLVLVPRYLTRVPEVVELVRAHGLRVALRSQGNSARAPVVVVDSVGDLAAVYSFATVAFVGGSFTQRGGQNILEPAVCGKPVLFGPNMRNFEDAVRVLRGCGGIQVATPDELYAEVRDLLEHPEKALALGRRAAAAVHTVTGATLRNVERLRHLVS